MSPQASRPAASARSPILAAVGISFVIGLGAVFATTDMATLEDVLTGKWFTRTFTETQQVHTVALAALEQDLGNVSRELDFVSTRVSTSIQRSEERSFDRFAQLDAEIAALKNKVAVLSGIRPGTPMADASEIIGLRASLHDLSFAHTSAVAALTKRLDKIEIKVGLSSDVVASPGPRKVRRTVARVRRPIAQPAFETETFPATARPDRGHLFNVKPLSHQATPLRLTRLPNTGW